MPCEHGYVTPVCPTCCNPFGQQPTNIEEAMTKDWKIMSRETPREVRRPETWIDYWFKHADLISTRSKDPSTKVGAVAVKDRVQLGSGYNGFARDIKDLPERYNDRDLKHKLTVHAEANLVANACRQGVSLHGSTVYVTHAPCSGCTKLLLQAGVTYILYKEPSPSGWEEDFELSQLMAKEAGVFLGQHSA